MGWTVGLALCGWIVGASAAAAQGPGTAAPPVEPAQPPSTAPAAPPPAEVYSYNPQGRRDPFLNLLSRGDSLRPDDRPEGLAGELVNDVTVRGIVQTSEGFVAMLLSPENRTYIVHVNDQLLDGAIKAITVDAVVFSQDVNDPLSLIKQREVRKTIRALQEGK